MSCRLTNPSSSTWGAGSKGYCADITRTYILGPPDEQFRKIYDLVRRAQLKAEAGLKAGMDSLDADALAREVIAAGGYGEAFGHSLGHGVGLAVHETPSLNPNKERRFELRPAVWSRWSRASTWRTGAESAWRIWCCLNRMAPKC